MTNVIQINNGSILQDLYQIAVGCVHLLVDHGSLEFPTSNRSSPSRYVTVILTPRGPLDDRYGIYFPFQVRGPFWNRVIVPVLEDLKRKKDEENSILLDRIRRRSWEDLIEEIRSNLVLVAIREKYLPSNLGSVSLTADQTDQDPVSQVSQFNSLEEGNLSVSGERRGGNPSFTYQRYDR